jgi:hypothetical protein
MDSAWPSSMNPDLRPSPTDAPPCPGHNLGLGREFPHPPRPNLAQRGSGRYGPSIAILQLSMISAGIKGGQPVPLTLIPFSPFLSLSSVLSSARRRWWEEGPPASMEAVKANPAASLSSFSFYSSLHCVARVSRAPMAIDGERRRRVASRRSACLLEAEHAAVEHPRSGARAEAQPSASVSPFPHDIQWPRVRVPGFFRFEIV